MRLSVTKHGLLAIGATLLMIAGAAAGTPRTTAAPIAAITATEPPTITSTSRPTNTPTAAKPVASPTRTPRPTKHENADPALTKSASVGEAKIGDEVTFTIHVTNNGPGTAEDVVVTDPIADYMDVIEATTTQGDVSSNGRTVIISIGRLHAGDDVTIRIRVRVNERAQPPSGRNSATVTTSSPGDDPSNNTGEVTFAIIPPGGLATATPALAPTATPVTPSALPPTGAAEDASSRASLIAAIGLIALALSLLIRGKARK